MVVENSTNLKFICCKGKCPGAPKNAPSVDKKGWQQILYKTSSDPFDMSPLGSEQAEAADRLRKLLPKVFGCGVKDVTSEVAESEHAVPCVEDQAKQACAR